MYNRYVPQPDGSYCRKQMQERRKGIPLGKLFAGFGLFNMWKKK